MSTINLSKFVGTISLGLLTGTSYTLTTTTLPPMLALPTAQPAHTTFTSLRNLTSERQFLLSALSSSSLLLAYTLSPPRGRHPFLLWATLAIGLGYGREIWHNASVIVLGKPKKGSLNGREDGGSGESSSDEEWEVENGGSMSRSKFAGKNETELNGEVVREAMEKWRKTQAGKAMVWGLGWVVCVVGLWGDGFGFAV
ncbi:hypothetical protein ACLMJK_002912 [Lecanora helva]